MAQIVEERVTAESGASPESANEQARFRRARERVQAVKGFYIHFGIYLVVNLGIFVLNLVLVLFNGNGQSWFFYWPLLGWGIAVLINAFVVFGADRFLGPDWEQRKINEEMARRG